MKAPVRAAAWPILSAWLAFQLLFPAAAWSQGSETQDTARPEVLTVTDGAVFVSTVDVVTVPVTVLGPRGEYVSGLEKADFTILDNEAEQLIDSFEVAFLPISMVICVQSSGRVEKLLPDVTKTAVIFTDMVLGEFGESALIAFDNRVRLMEDFTNDHKKIGDALKRITIGSDAVRLSDGVYEAIRLLNRRPSEHRKIVVVISESQENGSSIGLGETLRTAQLHDIMVYPIRLSTASARVTKWPKVNPDPIPPGVQARPVAPGQVATPTTMQQSRYDVTGNMIPIIIDLVRGAKNLIFSNPLELLAKGTGGKDYSPRTEDGLQESIAAIGEDIRSQYLLTYRPDNLNEGGIFHRIKVQVNYKGLRVRSRPGYFHGPAPVLSGEPAGLEGTTDP